MDVAYAAPAIPKFMTLINKISKAMLKKAGTIIAIIANFGFPSARIILFPIMQSARKGTDKIIGAKNSVAGWIIAPLAPKSNNISLLKKIPIKQKTEDKAKVIMIWFAKVIFALSMSLAPSARDKTDPPPTPIAIPSEEIKKVIGSTTVTAAMASEPIHCPTNIVSIKILTDRNKMPIDAGTACFMSSFFMVSVPSSSEETAI